MHPVQTIERTSKRWKALQVWSMFASVVGIFMVFGAEDSTWMTWGALLGIVGLGSYLYSRIGAWWENG